MVKFEFDFETLNFVIIDSIDINMSNVLSIINSQIKLNSNNINNNNSNDRMSYNN